MKEALLWNRDGIPTMIRIPLSKVQTQRLELAFRAAADHKRRDRRNGVRLAQRGRRHPDIAEALGRSTRSAPRWRNASLERGPDGRAPRKAPGAKPKIPTALAEELPSERFG